MEDVGLERAEWRSITTVPGERFVTIIGMKMMLELSVVNLGILLLSVLQTVHGLVKEAERFGWTMFSVREMRVPLPVVDTVHGVSITVDTMRMHQ